MSARQKGPADFDFAGLRAQKIVARAADDGTGHPVDHDQRAAACDRLVEERVEHRAFVPIVRGMDRPYERVGRDAVERVAVLGAQGAQQDRIAGERRLPVHNLAHAAASAGDCTIALGLAAMKQPATISTPPTIVAGPTASSKISHPHNAPQISAVYSTGASRCASARA